MATLDEAFEPTVAGPLGRKHGNCGARTELLQGAFLGEPPRAAAARDVAGRQITPDCAPVLHSPQQAEKERAYRLMRQVS